MTKIKFCGLSRLRDIEAANELMPDYIGFVFAKNSRRCVSREKAAALRDRLDPGILTVGVFVDEQPEIIAELLNTGMIDLAQLHGSEDDIFIRHLRELTKKPIIQAFRIASVKDAADAQKSGADFILLDSGCGGGKVFDWELIRTISRPYFLAGGLNAENAKEAVKTLSPYAVDVSSGIETNGLKDKQKMAEFAAAVRKEEAV